MFELIIEMIKSIFNFLDGTLLQFRSKQNSIFNLSKGSFK